MSEGEFEAKVIRKTDSAKGLFITLEITGDDYYGAVSQFRPGTLLRLKYEELDSNTGAPKELPASVVGSVPLHTVEQPVSPRAAEDSGHTKPRRPFHELPLSQQCAIRCSDKKFWDYLNDVHGAEVCRSAFDAAEVVREGLEIDSRSELDTNADAAAEWKDMDDDFQSFLTTLEHGDTFR